MSQGTLQAGRSTLLLKLLLQILHYSILVHEYLAYLASIAVQYFSEALQHLLPDILGRPLRRRAKARGGQPSFPTTLALVIAEDWEGGPSLDKLASLIRWSSEAGISTLQVYDQTGEAKQAAGALDKRLNPLRGSRFRLTVSIGTSETDLAVDCQQKIGRGTHGPPHTTHVILLDGQDSFTPLTLAALLGAPESNDHHELDMKHGDRMTTQALLDQLANAAGPLAVKEPNLMLVFGPVLTLAGFPPWLARHSEIYSMGRLAHVHPNIIVQALQRYCRTTQRFGT